MRIHLYRIVGSLLGLGIVLSCFVLFHLGGHVWQFSQLIGALVGGCVTLFVVRCARKSSLAFSPVVLTGEEGESWVGKEQLGWTLIGCAAVMWSIGECLWRIYVLALHQSPFPSWADMGYSLLPPLVFLGLLLQPTPSKRNNRDRLVRTEGVDNYLQRLTKALSDLSMALEQQRMGNPFRLPPSYREFPEIRRLLLAMGVSETPRAGQRR